MPTSNNGMTRIQTVLEEGFQFYSRSERAVQGVRVALVHNAEGKRLFLSPALPGFSGIPHREGLLCPLTSKNAQALAVLIPELRPKRLPPGPSFGFGDRLGLATSGHIRALDGARVFPVLAQQSARENNRTGRSFADVLADAVFGALQEGFFQGFGADADHLKSLDQAREVARLGYTFFTCDPSDFLVPVEQLSQKEVQACLSALPWDELRRGYLGRVFPVPDIGKLCFREGELFPIALKFWRALEFVEEMYRALEQELSQDFDFELSVDEAEAPTSPLEHLFLVLELRRRGVQLTSLAPRFSGSLEKAVDFRGDLEVFRQELRAHVAIARAFGPYKISLHSGSDKFSLYPILTREARGLWHVKTAGTSYLVALKVLAQWAPSFFRKILTLAKARFSEDRASYHLSAEIGHMPDPKELSDRELGRVLEDPNGRQVLHVTFGSVIRAMGDELRRVLLVHEEAYAAALTEHFRSHLRALGVMCDD